MKHLTLNKEINFQKATIIDTEELVDIRIRSMEPSLKAAGRFDPERARNRFVDTFIPEQTVLAIRSGIIIGFYMITESDNNILLNHLYVEPASQKYGLGKFFYERNQRGS